MSSLKNKLDVGGEPRPVATQDRGEGDGPPVHLGMLDEPPTPSVSRSNSQRSTRSTRSARVHNSGSEYGSADETSVERCARTTGRVSGEKGREFRPPDPPVAKKPGPASSKARKRKGSGASAASSDADMEVDDPEGDPTTKRLREGDDSDSSIASGDSILSEGMLERRGRIRARTTGEYVGLAKAKAENIRLEREELALLAERELLDDWTEPATTRSRKILLGAEVSVEDGSQKILDPSCLSSADLEMQLRGTIDAIHKVASFKKGLKGTSVRILKEAAKVVGAAGKELASRTQNDESRLLKEANSRLTGEVAELRRQLSELRERVANMAGSQGPAPPSSPPSGPSSMEVAAAAPKGAKGRSDGGRGVKPTAAPPPPSPAKGKGSKTGGIPAKAPPAKTTKAVEPRRAADGSDWTVVGRSGGKAAKAKGGAGAPPKAKAPKPGPPSKQGGKTGKGPTKRGGKGPQSQRTNPAKPRKIRPPKTAAVLLSTDPSGGGEKPAALGEAIAGVRSSIKLTEFGIASLKPKKAAGGGLLFEVPGPDSGPKADKLAEALRPLLEPKGVRVSRPVKLAELRVAGLDDSITPTEVQQAIAAAGGCSVGEVKVGKINLSPAGRLGSVWARCPAAAAKMVVDAGHLPIGWIRARVEALEPRPLQCFKCMGVGHSRAHCKAETDRSGLCYRCGQQGHIAAGCTAKDPHCPLCADGGHPANHRAQDLLLQTLAEWSIDLAVVAEPYHVPAKSCWIGDVDGLVTIISRGGQNALPLTLIGRGGGHVTAKWGEIVVVGVYFSPNRDLTQFREYLDRVASSIRRQLPGPVLVAGDLNAKSVDWGSPVTDARGQELAEWGAELGLVVLNRGSAHTCVRHNGGSIVDVMFGSPSVARKVVGWRVMEGSETLSNHRYIRWDISDPALGNQPRPPGRGGASPHPRWALKRLVEDALMAAASVKALEEMPGPDACDVNGEATWFREAMSQICDVAMPRIRALPEKKSVYWWSLEIAQLRATCVRERRQYTRCRRRRHSETEAASLYAAYREAKKVLQRAIKRAKDKAWAELLETLNEDPWGRPYLIIRKKLKSGGPRITESLHSQVLEDVVAALFPNNGDGADTALGQSIHTSSWTDDLGVTEEELAGAIRKLRAKNTAPGPDGIPGRAWVLALGVLGDRLRRLYTACLKSGQFPPIWKEATLVLLQKEGRSPESPSAYRPICLLDEAGKLFERVLVARLQRHLSLVGPDLADCQYGFREGRSTVDAIQRVRAFSDKAVSRGGVAMAVSLDIANAFNTLPWECIGRALEYHRVPPYMRSVLRDYLRDRAVAYRARYGVPMRRAMYCGVPQGSVLGPMLWNLGYNSVLRGALLTGLGVVCYADDTLVMARGKTWEDVNRLARVGVALVVGRIRALGLTVALHKTEAVYFKQPSRKSLPQSHITVEGVRIEVRSSMKYLGLHLDCHWCFREHFIRLAPRIKAAINSFGSLLPNIGGPRDRVRRLYMGVVGSMILYGAPVWSGTIMASRSCLAIMQGMQRRLAIRITRGYRTTPTEAALVVSGSIPWDLLAEAYAAMYGWRTTLRQRGVTPTPRMKEAARNQFRQLALEKWKERLAHVRVGLRAVGAIRPVLEDWVDRRPKGLPFRTVQVLTGHDCVGEYLYEKARREPTAKCHHCAEVRDTAQHTLQDCPAWDVQRRVLRAAVGDDLSLPAIVEKMVGSEDAWDAMVSFCEEVISQKEAAERVRENDPDAHPICRRKGGARRRAYALQNP
ncbi:uncharacterized protein LOC112637121 [Camponotus floridanus]|uniref:uncharacterized protein LOC112637121 n=1 Tax=Camponotus floridanus TaxID=104421 RepID=UPI000DC67962|nr:uncharacterized protein LOC112637121 [Camponotus floridanus]